MSDTINALKRLERAGDNASRSYEKLEEAARTVADRIERMVKTDQRLPRGYFVTTIKSNVGEGVFLSVQRGTDQWGPVAEYVDGLGAYLHGDFNCWIAKPTRETLLTFAKDIAEGLLEEIASHLEKRAQADTEAASRLENA